MPPADAPPDALAVAPGAPRAPARGGGTAGALLVAAGILLSRLAGLVRQRVFGHYLGTSMAADAYNAAWRIPNVLQNLLGEGVLSASFIPAYVRRLRGADAGPGVATASQLAGSIAALLGAALTILCGLGLLAAPYLVRVLAPGFQGELRELSTQLIRIFLPAIALLVASAWCIGVLNSHQRFFLAYSAPVVWSAAVIASLFIGSHWLGKSGMELAIVAAWGALAGSALQLCIQAPAAIALLGGGSFLATLRPRWSDPGTRTVVKTLPAVVTARGVVQISAYIDQVIASWLPAGTVSALAYAQTIYMLPISLFGMSVSAAALPSMSETAAGSGEERTTKLRAEVAAGLRSIAFTVVPSTVMLIALGEVASAALFQTGRFGARDSHFVWLLLVGSSLGLPATTASRLYSSTLYALGAPSVPLRAALVRVIVAAGLGTVAALWVPGWLGVGAGLGAVGLSAAGSVAAWIELAVLRHAVEGRVGAGRLGWRETAVRWGAALLAAAAGLGTQWLLVAVGLHALHPIVRAVVVLGVFGGSYLGGALLLGDLEARRFLDRVRRRLVRRGGRAS